MKNGTRLGSRKYNPAKAGEKARRKVELELAAYQGKELYGNTAPGTDARDAAERRT